MFQIIIYSRTSRTLFLILVIFVAFVFAFLNSNLSQIVFSIPSKYKGDLLTLPNRNATLGPNRNATLGPNRNATLGPNRNATVGPNRNTTLGPNRILPTIIPPKVWVRYPNDWWNGYQLPLLTVLPRGRFGNVLMEYATLYALSRVYNVSAVLHPQMKRQLQYFDNIYLQDLPGRYNYREWTTVQSLEKNMLNYSPLELAASGLLGPHRFVIQQWPHVIKLFDLVRNDIRQQYTWNKHITSRVQAFLRKIENTLKNKFVTDPVFIGVHIRRTDYVKFIRLFGGSQMPTSLYFKRAFDYYKKKYNATYFIISTDDKAYVNKNFKLYKDEISLTPGSSPQEDMAILNACNHSIITLGTFGFWTAYLAGGEVLYPDLTFTNKDYYFARPYYEGVGLYFKPIANV